MKKPIKFATIFISLHIFLSAINDLFIMQLPAERYEALGVIIGIPIFVYESPFLFIQHVFNLANMESSNSVHFIIHYLGGSILYFFIGLLVGYTRSLKK